MKEDEPKVHQKIAFSWTDIPRSIWYFVDKDRPRWLTLNIILLIILFYDIIPPLVLGKIVDFFTTYVRGDSLNTFYFYCVFLGGSYALVAYARLSSKNALSNIAISARTRSRIFGFERLVNLPLHWHAQENTGNKIERIFTGSQSILEWTRLSTNRLFPIIVTFIGIFIAFIFLSPRLAIFLIAYLALFFSIERFFNRTLSSLSAQINISRQRASGMYIEGSGNILAIKALGAEEGMNAQVRSTEERAKKLLLARNVTGTRKWYWFQTLNGISFTVFALLVGLRVVDGALTVGLILVFFSYFNKLREAANEATDLTGQMIEMKADLAAMMPIFRETETIKTGHETFPKDHHDIDIQAGSFTYPSGQRALSGFNFHLKHGEVVGVAGPSGSGKSTLVKILLGLYELGHGTFTVGKRSYYTIDHEDMIGHIGVVLQETELFNMTLQDNITLLREFDQKKLDRAVTIAQLNTVIGKLPDGPQTMVGERGYKLSGGERQRLGLARAIYKDAPIIILDEATSALDSQTEKDILDVLLGEYARDKTILIIAHRLSTLLKTDRIIYFEKGTIVEEGRYEALINNPQSKFAHLFSMQANKHSSVTQKGA